MRSGFFGLCLLVLSGGCFSTVPGNEGAPVGDTAKCILPEEADRLADQVLQLVNLERAERALQPVVISARLQRIAETYGCRMAEGKFFGHRDPLTGAGPTERAVAGKYLFYAIGENLAAGPTTAAEVMKVWMASAAHRQIILDPNWKEVGIAVRAGGPDSIYWVQEFGDPAGS